MKPELKAAIDHYKAAQLAVFRELMEEFPLGAVVRVGSRNGGPNGFHGIVHAYCSSPETLSLLLSHGDTRRIDTDRCERETRPIEELSSWVGEWLATHQCKKCGGYTRAKWLELCDTCEIGNR